MNKLTKEQKKIMYAGLIVLGSILLFLILVYLPQSRRLSSIMRQIRDADSQIAEIKKITEGRDLNEAVRELSFKLNASKNILPLSEEPIISKLSETADRLKINLKNVDPLDKVLLGGKILGYEVDELPIEISLSGEYRSIGEFVDIILNHFPALIKLDRISI